MVFCNITTHLKEEGTKCHNPYFNRWFSAIQNSQMVLPSPIEVTILILIDGFLQFKMNMQEFKEYYGHNPYFNRWFSAI